MPLTRGDLVIVRLNPDLGVGIIDWIAPDGTLVVLFEADGRSYVSDCGAGELERAKPKIARTA